MRVDYWVCCGVLFLGWNLATASAQDSLKVDALGAVVTSSIQVTGNVTATGSLNASTVNAAGAVKAAPGFGYVPVGTILPWYKVASNPVALPSGWVLCNGQVVTLPAGSAGDWLDGNANGSFTAPNLNANATYQSRGLFLRGGSNAGIYEDDLFESHTHIYNEAAGETGAGGDGHTVRNDSAVNAPTTATGGSETRPVNMSVVYIIRVE